MMMQSGFKNRVSITINTLVKNASKNDKNDNRRLEFEMRTVKDVPLESLVPNSAALRSIRIAGDRIDDLEEGPIEYRETIAPFYCCSKRIQKHLKKWFCINVRIIIFDFDYYFFLIHSDLKYFWCLFFY